MKKVKEIRKSKKINRKQNEKHNAKKDIGEKTKNKIGLKWELTTIYDK